MEWDLQFQTRLGLSLKTAQASGCPGLDVVQMIACLPITHGVLSLVPRAASNETW